MSTHEWIGIMIVIAGWAAQLVYTNGRQSRYNENVSSRLTDLDSEIQAQADDVKALRVWGETQIAAAIADRDRRFVQMVQFEECVGDLKRRLVEIEAAKIRERLAGIEAVLLRIESRLDREGK